MQEVRGEFKPIHRDWAMRLIDAALADKEASVQVKQLLERDFNTAFLDFSRFIRLWTWFWHEKNAGPYLRTWLATFTDEDWVHLISHAATESLESLAVVADRAHLLFQSPDWDSVLASAFAASEQLISAHVNNAGGKDWWALSRLSMAIGHAAPELAGRIWRQWSPERVAAAVHEAFPDQYDWVTWTLSGAKRCASEWVDQVSKFIRWRDMAPQLAKVDPGDLQSLFHCKEILNKIHAPILRSTIRDLANAMGECLSAAHLSDFQIGFPPIIDITWSVYAEDVRNAMKKVEVSRLAMEMSVSVPRDWRKLSDLSIWDIPPIQELITHIINQVDMDSLAQRVISQSQGCEHELRLLLHLVSHASAPKRTAFAARIYGSVKDAVSRNENERLSMTAAFLEVDAAAGKRLIAELKIDETALRAYLRSKDEDQQSLQEWEQEVTKLRKLIEELETSGDNYEIDGLIEQVR